MAQKGPRRILGLVCTQCGNFNYISERNRTNTPDKLELKKHCPKCGKHTLHKETSQLK